MKLTFKQFISIIIVALACSLSSAHAVTPSSVQINGDTLQAKLQVTSLIEIDLAIEFEKSIGLTADNIDISATLISAQSPSLTNRLTSNDIKLLPSLPVMISISPKSSSGFGFEGLASIEIYSKAVSYSTAMPARLFRSHDNGDFEDITSMVSAGSIRARGNTGSFSDFIILLDERNNAQIIADTFSQLDSLLTQHDDLLSVSLATTLQSGVQTINNALFIADYTVALATVENLVAVVENANPANISNVWRSSDDVVNMQGELLTKLKALRYSLRVN